MPKKKLPDPRKRKECKRKGCEDDAIFLEDFCWKHLSKEAKGKYKHKIENWVKGGGSLEYANLQHVDLQGAELDGAFLDKVNLQGANLEGARLNGAQLQFAKLQGVNLITAQLKKADLKWAKLKNAQLSGAELQRAQFVLVDFQEANLTKAELQESDCTRANFSGADLTDTRFDYAELGGVIWGDARYLQWDNIKKVGNEINRSWSGAWSAYLRLKNYFHQEGKYEQESKAYYREKLMAKKDAKSKKQFLRWFGLSIFHLFTGFGERWLWTVLWALGVIAFFAVIYGIGHATGAFLFDFKPTMIPSIFQYFYLSVVTFATLGFGDITPLNWQAQIPVVIEVIMGYVFLGLIITIIARRFGR